MSANALTVKDLSASYDKSPIIYDINFDVPAGRIVGIIGPNGAGKSTLIKALLGMIPKSRGEITVYGEPMHKALKRVGYMPQRESIDWDFPVTVGDVVLMGCYSQMGLIERPKKAHKERVKECLERMHMGNLIDRQIGNLSVGQQQRVFLARALAQESDLYFMDEPFAGVDSKTEHAIVEVLRELKAKGKSLLVIHHDLSTVKKYYDDVILLNRQIVAHGKTEDEFTIENLEKTYEGNLHIFKA